MRLLLIDDHPLFIEALATMLREKLYGCDINVCNSSEAALEQLTAGHIYDLILLDLHMPGIDGFDFIDALNTNAIMIPVAILSATNDAQNIEKLKAMGIAGFISKTSDTNELVYAIHTILRGNVYTPADLSFIRDAQNIGSKQLDIAREYDITTRQLEVLNQLSNGNTNRQIADNLCLSSETVKSHIRSLFNCLSVANRVECLNKARTIGLIN
ncbi:MAG: response regulator [Arenicella sp.]